LFAALDGQGRDAGAFEALLHGADRLDAIELLWELEQRLGKCGWFPQA
jgi:hypothetical protein